MTTNGPVLIDLDTPSPSPLKQGLKNKYVFLVCTICAISDAFLIGVGVAGFGAILAQFPQI